MSDDKSNRGQPDRSLTSGTQPDEVDAAARKLCPEFPVRSSNPNEKSIPGGVE